ncbi:CPBP family glutamic-type intramembrane protease [Streptococcus suis]|nr:CPBP family glutamic-type intramembrane protease [Streptococcus suis]
MKRVKNIGKFIGLVLLGTMLNLIPMILIGRQAQTPEVMKWLLSLGYLILAFGLIYFFYDKYKEKEKFEVRFQRFTWKDFGIAVLFFLATRLVAILGTFLIQSVTGNAMSGNDAALSATNTQLQQMFPLYFVVFHVMIGLIAPVFEELTFRGFFSRFFFQKKWAKGLFSSALFALLHVTRPIEFIMYFLLGLIFYLAYARRENIMDSIVVHMLNNGLIVVFSVINYFMLLFN